MCRRIAYQMVKVWALPTSPGRCHHGLQLQQMRAELLAPQVLSRPPLHKELRSRRRKGHRHREGRMLPMSCNRRAPLALLSAHMYASLPLLQCSAASFVFLAFLLPLSRTDFSIPHLLLSSLSARRLMTYTCTVCIISRNARHPPSVICVPCASPEHALP